MFAFYPKLTYELCLLYIFLMSTASWSPGPEVLTVRTIKTEPLRCSVSQGNISFETLHTITFFFLTITFLGSQLC